MCLVTLAVLSLLIGVTICSDDLTFPPGFKFGAASASYQVEGAWNVSDKTENIWDRLVHENPSVISELTNGDVACDSYHLWERDIELASELGIHFYRFSISWTRLMPHSFMNNISEDGKNYYNKLIDGLLAKGIEPLVTLYHFDLPQGLQDLGGWTNPLIAEWFGNYARIVYSLYADRVKTWLTINEPMIICDVTYKLGNLAPGIHDPEVATHMCSKNVLLAHAKAWRIYDEEFRHKYYGKVSIANLLIWMEAYADDDEDVAEMARQNMAGRYSHPIYSKDGDWPPIVKEIVAETSKKQGYLRSNLPAFTEEEIDFLKGTYDFYAINHYTSRLVRKTKPDDEFLEWSIQDMPEINATLVGHPDWKQTTASWVLVNPLGLRRQLNWLKKHYGDIEFIITENGCPTEGGLDDPERIEYYKSYLKQVLLAIKEDSVNVTGYTVWALLDNFEWTGGYKAKYGLYEVDFNSPERTRTPRASAHFYRELIRKHSLRENILDELVLVGVSLCSDDLSFPPGFKFGAASSSYQIEGAWNVSDKGESIWDRLVHEMPDHIKDRSTGDIACDSYHKWEQDIEMLSDLGVHFYRFSISWVRLVPNGFTNKISEDGRNYYNKLINGLLAKGIEPIVTLYHFELPQRLQDLGGWANPLIADWFADYTRVVFSLFGDRVKLWLTINEPIILCEAVYNTGIIAPPYLMPEVAPNICSKNVMMAHAKAWRVYDEEFKPKYHGKVSIVNNLIWFEPYSESDEEVAEMARENMAGRYSHPIYSKTGDWPHIVKKIMAKASKKQGYPRSYLPSFTKKEIEFVKGTYDLYAINYYTSRVARKAKPGEELSQWPLGDAPDINAKLLIDPKWKASINALFYLYPEGLRRQLVWLKQKYGDLEFFITENGFPTGSGLDDKDRVICYKETLREVLRGIKEDGLNITGFTAWTLMDNFEWMDGYSTKFGLYEVDFSSPNLTRTPRVSAHFYKKVIKNHSLREHREEL